MQPRGSMELAVRRLMTIRWRITWAAAAMDLATAALSPAAWVKAWLSGHPSHTAPAFGAMASAVVDTAGNTS